MARKRGESGLSFVVGIDKPSGMTSHDVVNACRRIFGERRVGHTGTLDPLASGVLPICVGPATRLDSYLTGHDKTYIARIAFGSATDTDDSAGTVISQAPIPEIVKFSEYAHDLLSRFEGTFMQTPPAYSAIKVAGRKAYDSARAGRPMDLEPREVTVHAADLVDVLVDESTGTVSWDVVFSVSAGTYIRALARDIGNAADCPAHLSSLRRTRVGSLSVRDCLSLDALETAGIQAALDPVRLLGFRLAFAHGDAKRKLTNGNPLDPSELELFTLPRLSEDASYSTCSSTLQPSSVAPEPEESVSIISDGLLKAIYRFDADAHRFVARTVFSQGVLRV